MFSTWMLLMFDNSNPTTIFPRPSIHLLQQHSSSFHRSIQKHGISVYLSIKLEQQHLSTFNFLITFLCSSIYRSFTATLQQVPSFHLKAWDFSLSISQAWTTTLARFTFLPSYQWTATQTSILSPQGQPGIGKVTGTAQHQLVNIASMPITGNLNSVKPD